MYSDGASFQFRETVLLSVRLRFLAELSEQCEKAGVASGDSPGFSITIGADGSGKFLVWNPSKWRAAYLGLRAGEKKGILEVTSPKDFSAWVDQGEAERKSP